MTWSFQSHSLDAHGHILEWGTKAQLPLDGCASIDGTVLDKHKRDPWSTLIHLSLQMYFLRSSRTLLLIQK